MALLATRIPPLLERVFLLPDLLKRRNGVGFEPGSVNARCLSRAVWAVKRNKESTGHNANQHTPESLCRNRKDLAECDIS